MGISAQACCCAGVDRPVDWLKTTGPVERPKSNVGGALTQQAQQRASSAPLNPGQSLLDSPDGAPLANGMPILPAGGVHSCTEQSGSQTRL